MFVYEAVLSKDEDGVYLNFPDFPGAVADGDDIRGAVEAAAETLQLVVADYLDTGRQLPDPSFGFDSKPGCIAVAVDVTEEFIERTKCITQKEAAEELGVTKGRIAHMLDDGVLQPVPFGNDRLVTIASVERRKREPKRAGRPRKTLTFDFPDHLKMWSVGASRSNYPIRSQGRWSGKTMIGFQSERLESGAHPDPSVFAGLEKAPMMYDGECRLGEESRECIVSVMEDGMLFIWVAVDSKGEGVLFAEGNALDGLAVFVRSQREGYFKEDFIR